MIVVTGATGALGSQIVAHLLDRVPAERVGVSVRDPARAADLAARGVRVRRGDFTDPASLADAFAGAEQVLVVSANATGGEAVAQHRAAIDAARAAGAARILYTSHQGASAGSPFAPMPDHAATEGHLAASGVPFTALRNGFYASTVPLLLGGALTTGELVAPADGPVSWTGHADLAAAAAVVLAGGAALDGTALDGTALDGTGLDGTGLDGVTPPLTAPDALDLADVARLLGELTGREVRRVVVDDDEWAAGLVARGVPADRAEMLLGMFRASRQGGFAATGPALADLLGRPVTPLRALLAEVVAPGARVAP
ncbi:NAD(P)H-binding protein [Pseudonocardia broussonetiae]|uniref:NAD(P)H-binding protein n=1 Tax=Pseudonocardia broussonetiae TaxID=2736640 RepID=A0A6M6JP77_9PSEU|nr:NAD(P)H-binding protein [Pseudonocardia broussonetiae]QJY49738.1 NAD(P)H-binding protein [Pseudonocardia broussonetiae]